MKSFSSLRSWGAGSSIALLLSALIAAAVLSRPTRGPKSEAKAAPFPPTLDLEELIADSPDRTLVIRLLRLLQRQDFDEFRLTAPWAGARLKKLAADLRELHDSEMGLPVVLIPNAGYNVEGWLTAEGFREATLAETVKPVIVGVDGTFEGVVMVEINIDYEFNFDPASDRFSFGGQSFRHYHAPPLAAEPGPATKLQQ